MSARSGDLRRREGVVKAISKLVVDVDESTDVVYFFWAEPVVASLETVPDHAHCVPRERSLICPQKCWRRDPEPG
jgi:hypothetical protein